MPLPLREPFFLQGRTSVVQRAVIMSLVLGGLAAVPGWIVALVAAAYPHGGVVLAIVWGLTVPVLICGPLNYWNCRPVWVTVVSVPLTLFVLRAFIVWMESVASTIGDVAGMAIGIPLVQLALGTLQVRLSRLHLVAWLISCLGAAPPVLILYAAGHNPERTRMMGVSSEVWVLFLIAGLMTSWLCALSIPWGIPFWWPPERTSPLAAESLVERE